MTNTKTMTAAEVDEYIDYEIQRFLILNPSDMLSFGDGPAFEFSTPLFGISRETTLWMGNLGNRDISRFSPSHMMEMKKAIYSGAPHFVSMNDLYAMDTDARIYIARLNGIDRAFFDWYWVLNGPFGNNS